MSTFYCDSELEPDTIMSFKPVYNYNDQTRNTSFSFDFDVLYTLAPEEYSDGEEQDLDTLENRSARSTQVFEKDWLMGGNKAQIKVIVCQILDIIHVPNYESIVNTLVREIMVLKKRDANSQLPKVEKINVLLQVWVWSFPENVRLIDEPKDSDEPVEDLLEKVVIEADADCAICLNEIQVGSGVEAGRMPCKHVFHYTCVDEWLRKRRSCPLCRGVFKA